MNGMFEECNELEYLILSKFNASNTVPNNKNYINQLNVEKEKVIKLKKELNNIMEQIIAVTFVSSDQTINCPMSCKSTDIFQNLKKELYIEYPELKHKHIYFIANGQVINSSVTLEQNKIKNRTIILIQERD